MMDEIIVCFCYDILPMTITLHNVTEVDYQSFISTNGEFDTEAAWLSIQDIYHQQQLVVVRNIHSNKFNSASKILTSVYKKAQSDTSLMTMIEDSWGVEQNSVSDGSIHVSDILCDLDNETSTSFARQKPIWYCSFILQGSAGVATILPHLPYDVPEFLPAKHVLHSECVWVFIGCNLSNNILSGRGEHTDSICHDGTWHCQIEGKKSWWVRPNDSETWPFGMPLISKPRLSVTINNGDFIMINTKLWFHETEIPPHLSEFSVSVARDFFFILNSNEVSSDSMMMNVQQQWCTDTVEEKTALIHETPLAFVQHLENRAKCLNCSFCNMPVSLRLQAAISLGFVSRGDVVRTNDLHHIISEIFPEPFPLEDSLYELCCTNSIIVKNWDIYCNDTCANNAYKKWGRLLDFNNCSTDELLINYTISALTSHQYDSFLLAAKIIAQIILSTFDTNMLSNGEVSKMMGGSMMTIKMEVWSTSMKLEFGKLLSIIPCSSMAWWDLEAEDEKENEMSDVLDIILYNAGSISINDKNGIVIKSESEDILVGDQIVSIAQQTSSDSDCSWSELLEMAIDQSQTQCFNAAGTILGRHWIGIPVSVKPSLEKNRKLQVITAEILKILSESQRNRLLTYFSQRLSQFINIDESIILSIMHRTIDFNTWMKVLLLVRERTVKVMVPSSWDHYADLLEEKLLNKREKKMNMKKFENLRSLLVNVDEDAASFDICDLAKFVDSLSEGLIGSGVYMNIGSIPQSSNSNCHKIFKNLNVEAIVVSTKEIKAGDFLSLPYSDDDGNDGSEEEHDDSEEDDEGDVVDSPTSSPKRKRNNS